MMMPDDPHRLSFPNPNPTSTNPSKKRRNLPGTPDPDAEVIALSPKSLMATNRFICEICNKGFQRDQNLQLHRRGHNLPWKLKQRTNKDQVKKKVYTCPEKSCVHHDPGRALGDLTGIKKHYSRKHGEKKWKCDKCSKKYAVMSDWKAHSKICGTREYRCDCGTLFSRKDSFITHRAFCDALAEESARFASVPPPTPANSAVATTIAGNINHQLQPPNVTRSQLDHTLIGSGLNLDRNTNVFFGQNPNLPDQISPPMNIFALSSSSSSSDPLLWQLQGQSSHQWSSFNTNTNSISQRGMSHEDEIKKGSNNGDLIDPSLSSLFRPNQNIQQGGSVTTLTPYMSATALLQKAAQMGSTRSDSNGTTSGAFGLMTTSSLFHNMQSNSNFLKKQTDPRENNLNKASSSSTQTIPLEGVDEAGGLTRDFLGVGRHDQHPFHNHSYPSNGILMLKHAPTTSASAAIDMSSTSTVLK